MLGNIH